MRRKDERRRFDRPPARAEQAGRQAVRDLPLGEAVGDLPAKASEVLDQHDPERDRHRPKLADG